MFQRAHVLYEQYRRREGSGGCGEPGALLDREAGFTTRIVLK